MALAAGDGAGRIDKVLPAGEHRPAAHGPAIGAMMAMPAFDALAVVVELARA